MKVPHIEMKIKIKTPPSTLPYYLAEKLIGLEIDLKTADNPEGLNQTLGENFAAEVIGKGVFNKHAVYVENVILAAEAQMDKSFAIMLKRLFLHSNGDRESILHGCIEIPAGCCQVIE